MTGEAARRLWQQSFVVVGGLLFLWSLLATIYLQFFRVPQRSGGDNPQLVCDFGQVYSGGACTSPSWMFLMFGVIGLGTAIGAAIIFRQTETRPEDVLRGGPGTRFTLAALASLVAVPLLYWSSVSANAGDASMEEWIRWGGTAYGAGPVFMAIAGIGFLLFAAAFAMHVFHEGLRKRFLALQAMHDEGKEPPGRTWAARDDEPRGTLPQKGFRWEST